MESLKVLKSKIASIRFTINVCFDKVLMNTIRSILASLIFLGVGLLGIGSGVAVAHDEETGGGRAYQEGYQQGYQQGYGHGYQDAVSGLGYENVAESHGLDGAGPFFEGAHEGEHVGYDDGYRAGRAKSHHHHHHHRD
jgi:hypothetical protein